MFPKHCRPNQEILRDIKDHSISSFFWISSVLFIAPIFSRNKDTTVFGTGVEEKYKSNTFSVTVQNQIFIWIFTAKSLNDILTCFFVKIENKMNICYDVTLNLLRELCDGLPVGFRKYMWCTENNLFLLVVKTDRGRSKFSSINFFCVFVCSGQTKR
jgi:hypothetical protein